MFLAGYGGMVSLMQLTIAALRAYMVAVIGASANTNISMGWPWWLATPIALALATMFGTLGGALAVRTEGIYTIMITLAIGAAFYYFTNQNWPIFNGHTGINTVATPHFLGVDWRSDIPFYYLALGAALCYFAVQYLSRAPFGLACKACATTPAAWPRSASMSSASGGRLCVRVVCRGTWGGPAGLELSAKSRLARSASEPVSTS
jgi:ABC-type branched-chain amino acid transport system, permease component